MPVTIEPESPMITVENITEGNNAFEGGGKLILLFL